jgi:hypothetical protein
VSAFTYHPFPSPHFPSCTVSLSLSLSLLFSLSHCRILLSLFIHFCACLWARTHTPFYPYPVRAREAAEDARDAVKDLGDGDAVAWPKARPEKLKVKEAMQAYERLVLCETGEDGTSLLEEWWVTCASCGVLMTRGVVNLFLSLVGWFPREVGVGGRVPAAIKGGKSHSKRTVQTPWTILDVGALSFSLSFPFSLSFLVVPMAVRAHLRSHLSSILPHRPSHLSSFTCRWAAVQAPCFISPTCWVAGSSESR